MRANKRVNIQLDAELHTKAKVISVLSGITLNQFLERAIADAVRREEHRITKIGGGRR